MTISRLIVQCLRDPRALLSLSMAGVCVLAASGHDTAALAAQSGKRSAASARDAGSGRHLETFFVREDGVIVADGHEFKSWNQYATSAFFQTRGLRCGTRDIIDDNGDEAAIAVGSTADCSLNNTNALAIYDPSTFRYRIPVVVHIIMNTSGQGAISDAMVQSQIDVLNEDYRALAGSLGAPGTNCQIEFYLAKYDPSGNPTTGITRNTNNTWFNDGGSYWNTLAWAPTRYLNIYTNSAGGDLGYVPFLPAESPGSIGSASDRVVVLWSAFGRNAPLTPYHLGRSATHEVGHYLGLFHTFQSGCATMSSPGCNTSGDRICDTPGEASANFGCATSSNSCSDAGFDPVRNYMDYSDDACMNNFTATQARRMRCTLENYRASLWKPLNDACALAPLVSNGSTAFSTSGATTDGSSATGCGFADNQVQGDVWFRYVASCTGSATMSLCSADYDTRLAVYAGASCPAAGVQPVACNDNTCGTGGTRSTLTFNVTSGQSYRIRIGGAAGAIGSGNLDIACTPTPVCPADTNASGIVDVDDLVAVVLNWGPCPNPSNCPADIAPAGGDDLVNVDDLIAIILAWGPCL